jgi:uncharacterized protein (DUF2236 family)
MYGTDLTVFLDAHGYQEQTALMVLEVLLGTLAPLLVAGVVYHSSTRDHPEPVTRAIREVVTAAGSAVQMQASAKRNAQTMKEVRSPQRRTGPVKADGCRRFRS